MYQLDIEADASENHWTCDHMCLAEWNDESPPIVHGAPTIESTDGAFKYVMDNSVSLCRINRSLRIVGLKVPSPETPTTLELYDFISPLFLKCIPSMNANNNFDKQHLASNISSIYNTLATTMSYLPSIPPFYWVIFNLKKSCYPQRCC